MSTIVHPVFVDFVEFATSEFWKIMYENMAYNKFPQGVYMMKNHLCCFHKGKEFSIQLDESADKFILFTHVQTFLSTKMGIRSEQEKSKFKDMVLSSQSIKDENAKKTIKDLTLASFVIREGEKNLFSDMLIRRIFSLLIVSFMFKTILVKDVIFNNENNEIEGIKGLEFQKGRIRFTRDILRLNKHHIITPSRIDHTEPIKMSSYWVKYIHNLSQVTLG